MINGRTIIPKYASKSTYAWFRDQSLNVLEWPVQSPDLNLIENIWLILKKSIGLVLLYGTYDHILL